MNSPYIARYTDIICRPRTAHLIIMVLYRQCFVATLMKAKSSHAVSLWTTKPIKHMHFLVITMFINVVNLYNDRDSVSALFAISRANNSGEKEQYATNNKLHQVSKRNPLDDVRCCYNAVSPAIHAIVGFMIKESISPFVTGICLINSFPVKRI